MTQLPELPEGYNLDTAQACAFLIDVGVSMGRNPEKYPINECSVKTSYKIDDFEFHSIIWWLNEAIGFTATQKATAHDFLVFRGAQTKADLFELVKVKPVPFTSPIPGAPENMKVENGFLEIFRTIEESIAQSIDLLKNPLTITGHSLGSAMSTLSVPLAQKLCGSVKHYNQGSPKVGNEAFANYLDSVLKVPTFRLVNVKDTITDIPCGPHYHHLGEEVSFREGYMPSTGTLEEKLMGALENNHNPCCAYAYAINHPDATRNPDFDPDNLSC